MFFIDYFLIEDSLQNYSLDTVDHSEVSLGIILGNLEKIKKVSLRFCESIQENRTISPLIKSVFLKKVLEHLFDVIVVTEETNYPKQNEIIDEFRRASDVLLEIFDKVQDVLHGLSIKYSNVFQILIEKFNLNENITSVIVASYDFKEVFSLNSSFFFLSYQEIIKLNQKYYFEKDSFLSICYKAFEIIHYQNLKPKDAFSIIFFNRFLEFSKFLVSKNTLIDLSEYLGKLIKYHNNFTPNQKLRIKETYLKLKYLHNLPENPEFLKLFNNEPRLEQRSNSKFPNNYRPKQSDSESIEFTVEKLLNDLKSYQKNGEVDLEALKYIFCELIDKSEKEFLNALLNLSYYETDKSFNSVNIWILVLKTIQQIGSCPEDLFNILRQNIECLKS